MFVPSRHLLKNAMCQPDIVKWLFNRQSLSDASVTLEDPIKEVADLMESTKEEGWEKSQANKQVTFVVYREGDQLNFFRVVDRGDGTLTPLSESLRFEGIFFNFFYKCASYPMLSIEYSISLE